HPGHMPCPSPSRFDHTSLAGPEDHEKAREASMRVKTPSFALAGALTLAAALLSPRAGVGQNVPPPGTEFQAPKLWWELGVGASSSRLSCSICDPDREAGPWADIAIGAYGTPRLRVGLH